MKKKALLLIGLLFTIGCCNTPTLDSDYLYIVDKIEDTGRYFKTKVQVTRPRVSGYTTFSFSTSHLYSVGDTLTKIEW